MDQDGFQVLGQVMWTAGWLAVGGCMALIRCSECGRDISDRASNCPGCGCPVNQRAPKHAPTMKDRLRFWVMMAVIFVPFALVVLKPDPELSALSNKPTASKPKPPKKELTLHEKKYGEKPKRSAWDGSYYEVERHLELVARDPRSVDVIGCTEPVTVDEGWEVRCDYRAANGFGGLVRESKWFRIAFGKVQGMRDAK